MGTLTPHKGIISSLGLVQDPIHWPSPIITPDPPFQPITLFVLTSWRHPTIRGKGKRKNDGKDGAVYEQNPRKLLVGVTRPTINQDTPFELKGQFLKELHDNTFNGSEHEDANEHIEKVLEIVDLFHIPKVTQDPIMLRAFPVLKTNFLNKYCPPARTAKKIEEINNFQQEPDESLFRAWERFKELLMECPQHYLTDMQKIILFYNGLDVPTRQILDSKGAIPSKTIADAKIAIWEMVEYSQKWHNGTSSRTRSIGTSDGLAAIQAQLNILGREIKKENEKVYAAQVGCELYKRLHYTKDCPQKEEGKTLEKAYYTQFGAPYQPGGQYRAAGPGFYQRNNGNSLYPDQRPSLEESLTKFMAESTKRHEENSNIIKEIRASTDAAIKNQGASIKTLEIQIKQMSKVLQERVFGSLPSSTEINPRDQVKSISTAKADFSKIRHIGHEPYAREAQDVKILDTYDHSFPQKEKDLGSFTLPCFIHNIYFDKALVDLGASVSVMSFSTYTNLGLGILSHTRLTIELADRTIKQPRGIAENVLVRIGKFIFPIDFIILDIPEDNDVPLILRRPFLSTAYSKIDVFRRKITLRVREENLEGDESFDPIYGGYIELNDLDTPLETKTDRDDFVPIFVKTGSYKMEFSCVIGYKYVITDLLPSLPINLMSKSFYYSIFGDKDEGKSHAGTLIDIPVFVGSFSIISGFTIIDDDDMTKDVVLGMKFCKKYASCQRIMKRFALGNNCERIMEDE
ncbi:ribonuclease H-like domain-containing protein [Tanacetum coccineum]|uniref:Ribonuclease H-like domain-containing protein n=1 Tax=Tanacetum coccineum TaxID=301880 RepID=A0ABQ5GIU3_9ASTR